MAKVTLSPLTGLEKMSTFQKLLPALGIVVTALLLLLVSLSLLDLGGRSESFPALRVRILSDKKNPEEMGKEPDIATELGEVRKIIKEFPQRARKLDVEVRILGFLTIWTAANIVQGAATIVVLVLSIMILWKYLPGSTGKLAMTMAALIIGSSILLVFFLDYSGTISLSMRNSISDYLQKGTRHALGIDRSVDVLTTVGNISIAFVTFLASWSLCVLLSNSGVGAPQFREFQQFMYWTSLLLVAGVVQVAYQNRMPTLLFDDEFNKQQIAQMASAIGLLVGGVFTVALALVFLPTGFILASKAGGGLPAPKKNWFTEIIAVLAPLLAALPIGKLFDITV